MKITIANARYQYLNQIMEVLEDGKADSTPLFPKIETPFIYHELVELIDKGLAVVAIAHEGSSRKIVGFAALDVNNMPWAPSATFFNNKFYIVLREYRSRSDAGVQLLKAMQDIAMRNRMDLVVSVNSVTDAPRKIDFLEKRGGIYMGANMLFPIPRDEG